MLIPVVSYLVIYHIYLLSKEICKYLIKHKTVSTRKLYIVISEEHPAQNQFFLYLHMSV